MFAIHAASLEKQNLTNPSAQFRSSPVEKVSLRSTKKVVSALWYPALVLAALLLFGNVGKMARRSIAFTDCYF